MPPKVQKEFVGEPGGGGNPTHFFGLFHPWNPLAPFWARFASQAAPGPSQEVILMKIYCYFSTLSTPWLHLGSDSPSMWLWSIRGRVVCVCWQKASCLFIDVGTASLCLNRVCTLKKGKINWQYGFATSLCHIQLCVRLLRCAPGRASETFGRFLIQCMIHNRIW